MTNPSLPSEQPAPESCGTWGDTDNLILGFWLLLAGMAGAALITARAWKEAVIAVIGPILIAAPWAFGFEADRSSLWNSLICGALVVVFAAFRLSDIFDEGHQGHDHGVPAT